MKNSGWGKIDVNFYLVRQYGDRQSKPRMLALQQNCTATQDPSFCVILFSSNVASSGEFKMSHYQIHFQATSSRKGKKIVTPLTFHWPQQSMARDTGKCSLCYCRHVPSWKSKKGSITMWRKVTRENWCSLNISHIDISIVRNTSLKIILLGIWQDLLADNYYSEFSFLKYCLLLSFSHQKQWHTKHWVSKVCFIGIKPK